MKKAPWTFDLAELAPAVLLFGHMGLMIAGDKWPTLFASEAAQGTTTEMRLCHRLLPAGLTAVQKLMFKPAVDLTLEERDLLISECGDDTNHVVRYFQRKKSSNSFYCTPTTAPTRHPHSRPVVLPSPSVDHGEDKMDLETKLFGGGLFDGPLPFLTDSEDEGEEEIEIEIEPEVVHQEQEDRDGDDDDDGEIYTLFL
ncbi:hypothetical protein B0H10DRAFT_2229680 [Mycena sp. CBHHK59/15]|nr:hypothetical protein B0H10DRAFT_2229680 [Mycena sp. CBHHK59/15]